MEIEQITKQVNWLDEERRKDKLKIGALEERLNDLTAKIPPLERENKELEGQVTRLGAIVAKVDGFEEVLLQNRIETKQQIEELDKISKKRADESDKVFRTELHTLETGIAEVRKELEQFPDIKRNLKNRVEEELRLSRMIDEVRTRIEAMRRSEEEYTRTIRVLEDGRRQDSKRITDQTGEVSALRKRADEQGGKLELSASSLKKMETRISELSAVEAERREAISNFLDGQALKEVERERIWKEWQMRFEQIESQASEIENSLQTLESTQRTVKRSQQTVDELTQKVERRISEITEIQRLAEERFRQEWATFKADDQKRWTNYILTMEEQRNEGQRLHERLGEKVTQIEDEIQEIQDLIQQMNEHTEKRLQALLAMTHEWVTSYERTVGRAR
jgi:chromosome segregation ATPase